MSPSLFLTRLFLLSLLLLISRCACSISLKLLVDEPSEPVMSAATIAYKLEHDIDITIQYSDPNPVIEELHQHNIVDGAVLSLTPGASTSTPSHLSEAVLLNKHIVFIPLGATAITPVYSLPNKKQIVLSREVLVSIFLGHITWWNDSAIVGLNGAMPSHPIVMVVNDEHHPINQHFAEAMAKFDPLWTMEQGAPTDKIDFPVTRYANYLTSFTPDHSCTLALMTPYSMSYCDLAYANSLGHMKTTIINAAGQRVTPTTDTVGYALLEKALKHDATSDSDAARIDLSDGAGTESWPFVYMFGMFMSDSKVKSTCAAKRALSRYLLWFLSSPVVAGLALERSAVVLPQILFNNLNLDAYIRTGLKCHELPVLPVSSQFITLAGLSISTIYSDLVSLYLGYYQAIHASYNFRFYDQPTLQSLLQLRNREIDYAIIAADIFYKLFPGALSSATSPLTWDGKVLPQTEDEVIGVPYGMHAIVPVYSLPSSVTSNFTSYPIVLDLPTLAMVFSGQISRWSDSRLARFNPNLPGAFMNASADDTITLVVCCTQEIMQVNTFSANVLVSSLLRTQEFTSSSSLVQKWPLPVSWTPLATALQATHSDLKLVIVDTEQQVESTVNRLPGSIGYKLTYSDVSNIQSEMQILNYYTTANTTTQSQSQTVDAATLASTRTVAAEPSFLLNCAKAAKPAVNTYSYEEIWTKSSDRLSVQGCWPLTFASMLVVPSHYVDEGDTCERGSATLEIVKWLVSNQDLDQSSKSRGMLQLGSLPQYLNPTITALNSIRCGEETILITLPVYWTLSAGVQGFGYAMAIVGWIICAVSLLLIASYRNRTVLRSSSVPFQVVILGGLALLLAAILLVAQSAANSTCQAAIWIINIGFTLTFAPLFAKMWRIYKIFDRQVLKVVKISNQKLGAMVATLVAIDIILLAIWQGYSPPRVVDYSRYENNREHIYMECGGSVDSLPFLFILMGLKAALLVFGSYMGFTTRNVASTFNESKNVAWAIYNVVFSVIIIIPIMFFTSAHGDAQLILLIFLLSWVVFCTWLFNFLSKFMVLFKGEGAQGTSTSAHSGTEATNNQSLSKLFSFPPVHILPNNILDRYLLALETQMKFAKQKHTELLNGHNDEVRNRSNRGNSVGSHNSRGSNLNMTNKSQGVHGAGGHSQIGANLSAIGGPAKAYKVQDDYQKDDSPAPMSKVGFSKLPAKDDREVSHLSVGGWATNGAEFEPPSPGLFVPRIPATVSNASTASYQTASPSNSSAQAPHVKLPLIRPPSHVLARTTTLSNQHADSAQDSSANAMHDSTDRRRTQVDSSLPAFHDEDGAVDYANEYVGNTPTEADTPEDEQQQQQLRRESSNEDDQTLQEEPEQIDEQQEYEQPQAQPDDQADAVDDPDAEQEQQPEADNDQSPLIQDGGDDIEPQLPGQME